MDASLQFDVMPFSLVIVISALRVTASGVLTELTSLRNNADSILAGINGILRKTYDSELGQANVEFENAQDASTLAMSAKYNATAHKNMSINLNKTALEAEGSLKISMAEFEQMRPRIDNVTKLTDEAVAVINKTKVYVLCCDQLFQLRVVSTKLRSTFLQFVF